MELQKIETNETSERLAYTKPQLTVFGDVRSLTATGSILGSEGGGSAMSMIMA